MYLFRDVQNDEDGELPRDHVSEDVFDKIPDSPADHAAPGGSMHGFMQGSMSSIISEVQAVKAELAEAATRGLSEQATKQVEP